jgi:two-component system sensor histidine kinase CiaH
MIHKLQRKFIAIAMVSVTLVMLFLGVTINVVNFVSTNKDLTTRLEMIFENEGSVPQFSAPDRPGQKRDPHFTAETPFSTRYFVLRYTEDGTLLSANMKNIAAVTEENAETYLNIAVNHGEGFGYSEHYKFYVASTEDSHYMAIFLDCYGELHTLQTFAAVSLLVVLTCIVLVFVLVVLLSKRAIAPTIQAIEKQKRFITDASHELKTPLTVITTSLKVLEMDTGKSKWTEKIQGQTDKMSRLVKDLVTLSRLDEEHPPLQISEFNISAAVSEVAESFQDHAFAHGHVLVPHITPDILYAGDEAAIRQLVSILLDNATKYSAAGGEITLELRKVKKKLFLQTTNPCTALNPEEAEKLFDRFYRPDRSRTPHTGGFGIGLSIAKRIVESHGGSIKADCSKPGSIQFTVEFK